MWSIGFHLRKRKLILFGIFLRRLILVIIILEIIPMGFNMIKTTWDKIEHASRENQKMKEIADRMEARRRHLKAECARLGLDGPGYNASTWEFLVNRQYHIIWCHVFKAGSSSWLYNFNIMANYSPQFLNQTDEIPVQLARLKYPRPTLDIVQKAQLDSKTFIIVRHPLERLASAYRDKIVNAVWGTSHHFTSFLIVKYYRKKVTTEKPRTRYRRRKRIKMTIPLNRQHTPGPDPYRKIPLFEEFVSYVLEVAKKKRLLDMHWVPYTTFCTPCKINFDMILKMETLDEDQKYLIKAANLTGVVEAQWLNKRKTGSYYINSLYSRITKEQLDGLYELYKYDFQLFNYSIESYYDVVENFKNKRMLTTERNNYEMADGSEPIN